MTLKLVLDRFEGDIGVCLEVEDDKRHFIGKDVLVGIEIDDIFTVEHSDGIYHDARALKDETAEARESISKRMNRLFKISKNRRPPKV